MLSGMEIGYPDLGAQPLLGSKNLRNATLVLLVPLPAILVTWLLFHWFPTDGIPAALPVAEVETGDELAAWMSAFLGFPTDRATTQPPLTGKRAWASTP